MLLNGTADAQLPPHQPKVCTGYDEQRGRWGMEQPESEYFCPPHHVIVALPRPTGSPKSAAAVKAIGSCCPLPAEDILTDESVFVVDRCPDNFVATGNRELVGEIRQQQLRCTKINTNRYMLGPPNTGVVWGASSAAVLSLQERKHLKPTDIPAALRLGVMRRGKFEYLNSGCIGEPFGSILVEKSGKTCSSFSFQQLFFSRPPDSSESKIAVTMFPECQYLSKPFSTTPDCKQ